jgi:hypothetical protein
VSISGREERMNMVNVLYIYLHGTKRKKPVKIVLRGLGDKGE